MPDIKLIWDNENGYADWSIVDGDVQLGDELDTAIMISLFSDAPAPDGFVPTDGTEDPRGWWADAYRDEPIGSLLWTLERAKKSGNVQLPLKVRDYAKQSLMWLVRDGIASSVKAEANYRPGTTDVIDLRVTVFEPNILTPRNRRFQWSLNQKQ